MTINDTTQIPGAAYAGQAGVIRDAAEDLGVYLAIWSMRDDGKPDAQARRAANDAMDAIDRALRELHALRERLVGDIRQADDAAAARVDAMLAERRAAEISRAPGSLSWTLSGDGTEWRAQLPDGRTAVIRRVLGEDGEGSLLFVPAVYESASDFVPGPECARVLGAAAWCAQLAGGAR